MQSDLDTLRAYAKSLGFKVRVKKKLVDAGYCYFDPPVIEVAKDTATEMVLTLLHELGHALDWIRQGKRFHPDEDRVDQLEPDQMTEADRSILYESESRGIKYMYEIWKVLNLSIPEYMVLAEQRYDRWQYMNFRYFGDFPRKKQRRAQRNRFRKKVQEEIAKEAWRNRYQNI